ncbi:MAG TPA: aspartate aminotransferase family protein, partial [Candidatus Ozemobacteraceae bacterium]|nr:aspartate aminotransferase family protein [Candidatus Ozemobacteraceae bacterium]
ASISVGHTHPLVTARVHDQIAKLNHCTMLYQTRPLLTYLQAIQAELPDHLCRHFFVNSGSEAMDFACQAARAHRQKPLLIAFSEGFHGGSFQSASVTGLPAWQPVYGADPQVAYVPVRSCRFCPHYSSSGLRTKRLQPLLHQCPAVCLDPLEDLLRQRAPDAAAILFEPVLGVGGILVPCLGFFERLQHLVDQYHLDLVCDEVQSGFGRLGYQLFGFQVFHLRPDIVCMAKGIANGYPMGLVSATEEVSAAMGGKPHFSTFGGNPVSCTAALATLETIKREQLILNAQNTGEHLLQLLDEYLLLSPFVLEIRGLGLMIGIEFDTAERAHQVVEHCFERGLLVGLGGRERNVVRIEPPLTFTIDMALRTAETLAAALQATRIS